MKELGIITIRNEDNYFLGSLIQENIHEQINIKHYVNFPIDYPVDEQEKVLLLSGGYLEENAKQYFPNSRIIVPQRTFPTKNLEEIILIPDGEKVLVVNYPRSVVENVILELKRIGINHLDFYPYDLKSDVNYSNFNYAITFGLEELCPKGIPNIIDVGKRAVSVCTFTKIIEALELDIQNLDTYFTAFQNMMIKGNYRVAGLLRHSEDLMRNLQYIYKTSSDGILCIDQENNVSVINSAAEDILELDSKKVGLPFSQVLKAYQVLISLISKGVDQDGVLLDNSFGEKIVLNISFPQESSLAKVIIFVTKYNKIQKSERKIRHKIYKENQGMVAKYNFSKILGNSRSIDNVKSLAMQYAGSDLNILIEGESGTGKELFAQSIHNYSNRAKDPFVACNFAALPENLVESELFGYEEGAFTGATKGGKPGLFEVAHGGTILLDEIGDASLAVQTKLLRVLEEREVMRIGSPMVTPVDIRVICATNKNLMDCISNGTFRKDLYYRIKILPLVLPCLKDRIEDIPYIVEGLASNYDIPMDMLKCIIPVLQQHSWPGNVRELKSMIQYLSVILPTLEPCSEKLIINYATEYLKDITTCDESMPESSNKGIAALDEVYNAEMLLFVLESLLEARNCNKIIGREKICSSVRTRGMAATDSQIRTALKALQECGYIRTGTTRQGSTITQKGLIYLNSKLGKDLF